MKSWRGRGYPPNTHAAARMSTMWQHNNVFVAKVTREEGQCCSVSQWLGSYAQSRSQGHHSCSCPRKTSSGHVLVKQPASPSLTHGGARDGDSGPMGSLSIRKRRALVARHKVQLVKGLVICAEVSRGLLADGVGSGRRFWTSRTPCGNRTATSTSREAGARGRGGSAKSE